jgi:hypothetical protein
MYGVHMEIYVVFRGKPPAEWAEVPGVKAVSADSLASIEGKFVLVVGDRELAERLKVSLLYNLPTALHHPPVSIHEADLAGPFNWPSPATSSLCSLGALGLPPP